MTTSQLELYTLGGFQGLTETVTGQPPGTWISNPSAPRFGSLKLGPNTHFASFTVYNFQSDAPSVLQGPLNLPIRLNLTPSYGLVITSNKTDPDPNEALLFIQPNFTGPSYPLRLGQNNTTYEIPNLTVYGLHDLIKSIKVGSNVILELYPIQNFSGSITPISQNSPSLPSPSYLSLRLRYNPSNNNQGSGSNTIPSDNTTNNSTSPSNGTTIPPGTITPQRKSNTWIWWVLFGLLAFFILIGFIGLIFYLMSRKKNKIS